MKRKVVNIRKMRNKKHPRSPEKAAEAAARVFLDKIPPDAKEPDSFASGGIWEKLMRKSKMKMIKSGAQPKALCRRL